MEMEGRGPCFVMLVFGGGIIWGQRVAVVESVFGALRRWERPGDEARAAQACEKSVRKSGVGGGKRKTSWFFCWFA